MNNQLEQGLYSALEKLTPREQFVIIQRFGLRDKPKTVTEIASYFQVSRGRIYQIESKSLRKLRHPSRNIYLRPFYSDYDKKCEESKSWDDLTQFEKLLSIILGVPSKFIKNNRIPPI